MIDAGLITIVEQSLAQQEAELVRAAALEADRVTAKTATGTGHIDHAFDLARTFRLVYIRCHFTGAVGTADFKIALDSVSGSAYDTLPFTVLGAGVGRDVNFRLLSTELTEPSAWTFRAGDQVRVQWTNPSPGSITWGLEVGLAPAR